ncbi:hypothetical protein [Corynebacterium variabile]|uniref:hypothetical protein n=1 Tax=Corynebacterium variabile TaxID=1727 RepID=UPI003FD3899D
MSNTDTVTTTSCSSYDPPLDGMVHMDRKVLLTALREQDAHDTPRLAARADEVTAWIDRMYPDSDDQVSVTDILTISHAYPAHHTLAIDLAATYAAIDTDLRRIIRLAHATSSTQVSHPGVTAEAMRDPWGYVADFAEDHNIYAY